MIFPLNLNDIVYVRLTNHGLTVHRDWWHDLSIPNATYVQPQEDAEGRSRWHLWELFSIFGPHIYMGCVQVFIDNDIEVDNDGH